MKAFVITLKDNEYSERCADRGIASGKVFDITVEKFYGVDKYHAEQTMLDKGLIWTWADMNTREMICPHTGLKQFPYKDSKGNLANIKSKIGCSMSHYLLWEKCAADNTPMLILEHDAVFIRRLPYHFGFFGICQINDPRGATHKGNWWSNKMINMGKEGIFPKTLLPGDTKIPDGLAGNSAYAINPWAAKALIVKTKEIGLWPNDALMCIQLFPWLEEYYPFVTIVKQEKSTSVT